jgi:hypothetical protein
LGAVLCHRPLEPVFLIHPRLGRKEDSAPSGQSVQASRLRLEAMEQGRVVRRAGSLFKVPSLLSANHFGSRSSLIGFITFDVHCAGARSAGNPHATCEVAGAGNQLTVRIVRHSQRKRGATDRPDLRSNGASPRPYPCRVDISSSITLTRKTVFPKLRSVKSGPTTCGPICPVLQNLQYSLTKSEFYRSRSRKIARICVLAQSICRKLVLDSSKLSERSAPASTVASTGPSSFL